MSPGPFKRVSHPGAGWKMTAGRTNHVSANVILPKEDANGDLVVRSRFHMMEFRNDTTRHFAGSYIHHLKRTKAGHRIKLQRVDMGNAEGPYEYALQAGACVAGASPPSGAVRAGPRLRT